MRASGVSPSQLKERLRAELARNRPSTGFAWKKRFFFWLFSLVLFGTIASFALLMALGQRINWHTLQLEQTAVLQIDASVTSQLPVTVRLDNQVVGNHIPLRLPNLRADDYHLQIERQGYQTIVMDVALAAGQRLTVGPVLMLYSKAVLTTPPTDVSSTDSRFFQIDQSNLHIRSRNELWINGQFITRTSDDILNARWYVDHQHVVMQLGSAIVILDQQGQNRLTAVQLGSANPADYFFTDNGRIIVYLVNGVPKAAELFERPSLF